MRNLIHIGNLDNICYWESEQFALKEAITKSRNGEYR